MEWIFDGIGTEIVSLIIGVIFGILGNKLYLKNKNKQSQKAGSGAIQIQTNSPNSPIGDYVGGNKIIANAMEELDIRNFSRYSNSQIEDVISKGNEATLRRWCLELIINQKQDYLIKRCIEKMDNNEEKFSLLMDLSRRNYTDSEYFRLIANSLTSAICQAKMIDLYISLGKSEYIKQTFVLIKNNKYIFDCLVAVHNYNKNLFNKLYNNGKCFSNQKYKVKMKDWLMHTK